MDSVFVDFHFVNLKFKCVFQSELLLWCCLNDSRCIDLVRGG